MNTRKLERIINNAPNKTVIAIDGYSGVGKTTLLTRLAEKNDNILPVFMDDFMASSRSRNSFLKRMNDKSKVFELHWYDYSRIKRLIKKFKSTNRGRYRVRYFNPDTGRSDLVKSFDLSKRILIVEGIFLFHPRLFKDVFDIKIYLDTNIKEADRRRVIREKKRWGKDYFPEDHPDSFTRLFKIAHERYRNKYLPKRNSDYVFKI